MWSSELSSFHFQYHFVGHLEQWALVFTYAGTEYTYGHYDSVKQCENVQNYLLDNNEYIEIAELKQA